MKFKVGQIFYLVGAETAKVIPFRIIEEVTRTTLKGEEKTYIAELPNDNHTHIDVSKLKGKIFDNIESLRNYMIDNAKNAIEAMIDNALTLSSTAYNIQQSSESDDDFEENNIIGYKNLLNNNENTSVQNSNKDDIIKVDIGNGVIANMKKSDLEKVAQ